MAGAKEGRWGDLTHATNPNPEVRRQVVAPGEGVCRGYKSLISCSQSGIHHRGKKALPCAVEPTTLICNGRTPDGRVCGATALVIAARPVIDSQMYRGGGGIIRDVLRETHYDIECPRCGSRTQIVKADAR